jgi:biopolymer transport protein TolQ
MHGDMNILVILLDSGPVVKFVLLLLVVASIFSWAIVFQKNKLIKKVELENKMFLKDFETSLSFLELSAKTRDYDSSSLGFMFQKGHDEILKIKEITGEDKLGHYFKEYGLESLERALKVGVNSSNEVLEKKMSILASIGSVTPFVGLFGTVWGIINSFTGLSQGGGSIEAVAPGIAEALVATAVGLAAAIPAVWFFNNFNNKISTLNSQMESFGQQFLNLVERTFKIKKDI